jgi:hypothetical protein
MSGLIFVLNVLGTFFLRMVSCGYSRKKQYQLSNELATEIPF